ncbi:DedA family protein [Sphingomonas piscis]|uniref:DedA family protein n=2 Tax=Sphingomonas piscis TaxID=2714943 RepID=A0A6G7YTG6_9SPHN|nr:DedA family protein [Sphingomonas piscis]
MMQNYGLWAVFVLVFLESSGLPLPGETALVTAAIYAGTTDGFALHEVIAVGTAAAVLGDTMGFFIGRTLGLKAMERLARRFPSAERRLLVGEFLFLRHGGKIVFWGRFVALLRVLAALLAGANKMPWRRFAVMNALGGLCWATFFSVVAYAFGDVIRRIEGPLGLTLLGLTLCGIVIGFVLFRRYEQRIIDHAIREMEKANSARVEAPELRSASSEA